MNDATLTPCPGCTTGKLMRYPDGEGQCVGDMFPGPLGWITTVQPCGYATPKEVPVTAVLCQACGGELAVSAAVFHAGRCPACGSVLILTEGPKADPFSFTPDSPDPRQAPLFPSTGDPRD